TMRRPPAWSTPSGRTPPSRPSPPDVARLTEALRRLWSPVEVHEVVGSSRPDVFRTLADPTTYPDWLVGAQRIRHVDPAFPAPSSGFDHSVGPTPSATVDDSTEARRVEAPARLDLL